MKHSKDEIIKIINQLNTKKACELESETLDFKAWTASSSELYKTLVEYAVCFANQRGGTLVLGVKDNVVGIEKAVTGCSDYDIFQMKSRIYEATDPKILVDIYELRIEKVNATLLVVNIPQGIGIHTGTDGTAKIRIGCDCKPLTGSMRQKKMIELGISDMSGEVLEKLTINDLDKIEIERFKNAIRGNNPSSALLKLSDRELLNQTGVLKENKPTVAGLILVGKEQVIAEHVPNHEIVYLRMKNSIDYEQRADYKSPILKTLESLNSHIEVHNKITTVSCGLFNIEVKDYPEATYREAFLNAILHRDYLSFGAVFIHHFKNKLVISNPGGFIGNINPENILRQNSKPRNRHLAEILRKIGLVEKAGIGIKKMFYTQLACGKQAPVYSSDEDLVRLTINDGTIDEHFVKFMKKAETENIDVGLDSILVLSVLKIHRELNINAASRILQLDEEATRAILSKLRSEGLLEKSGTNRGTTYHLSARVYKLMGESASYIREKGIDEVRYPELISNYLKKYHEINNSEVRQLLGVDIYKASKLLKKLSDSGFIERLEGGNKAARYRLKKT
jgi:ATP-dependent DNA helicase RecG